MTQFRKGEVIVCIDAKPDDLDPRASLLKKGGYYRVGACDVREDGELAVAFASLASDSPGKGWAFCVRRFRRVRKAKSDFTASIRRCQPHKTGVEV